MADVDEVRRSVRPGVTKLVWIETPANPLWTITDIAATADIAHAAGAMLAVDSTVGTPVLTRPIALGADIVMHSATKYLNGHSDVIAGALVTREDSPLWQRIRANRAQLGGILGPFEAWLLTRGMRTLFPRVPAACASAQAIAEHFARHDAVAEVLYPGLPSFKGHDVARRQMRGGFGGMLSIRVRGGEAAAIATAAHVKVWKRATSLGGVESLVEHRASVEGAGSPAPVDLLRLSVGSRTRRISSPISSRRSSARNRECTRQKCESACMVLRLCAVLKQGAQSLQRDLNIPAFISDCSQ